MPSENTIFEKTYEGYLAEIKEIDFKSIEQTLTAHVKGGEMTIPLFGHPIKISVNGIEDSKGNKPSIDVCIIISKYILLCPEVVPIEKEWVSYRDLKDSGPLTAYFANDVERAIATFFSGRLHDLKAACDKVGGYLPDMAVHYDLARQFHGLPRIPVMMLFNDRDEEFPAHCSVLFERRAERFLDAECLAMVGRLLFTNLKKAATGNEGRG